MPAPDRSPDELRRAIEALTSAELVRLGLIAKTFDPRREEDLLQEAIARTLSGGRRWRSNIELCWHLHEAMRSIAWDWAKKRDENFLPVRVRQEDDAAFGALEAVASSEPDPESQAHFHLAVERLIESLRSDAVVVAILNGKLEGKTGPEIRQELDLSEKDFNAAAQRLRRSARAVIRRRQYA